MKSKSPSVSKPEIELNFLCTPTTSLLGQLVKQISCIREEKLGLILQDQNKFANKHQKYTAIYIVDLSESNHEHVHV